MRVKPTKDTKPGSTKKSKASGFKSKYCVVIEDSEYITMAYNEEGALSNAAFRYGEENDEEVALVMWKIKHDKYYSLVEEAEG
jgi:hypothetical protein